MKISERLLIIETELKYLKKIMYVLSVLISAQMGINIL